MKHNSELVFDGFNALYGGMDSNRAPSEIDQNQVAYAENVTFRGGFARNRSPLQNLQWLNGLAAEPYVWMRDAVFQGFHTYQWLGQEWLVTAVGGRIFKTILTEPIPTTYEVTPPGLPNTQKLNKVWFCQAQQYLIIQDGINTPILFDGHRWRRSTPPEVPTGTIMAYGLNRLWLVRNGNQIVAGDIAGGPTNVISFTETTYLNGGGYFTIPLQGNEITGLGFTGVGNTQTGQGPLLVFTNTSISSIDGLIPRSQWQNQQIQQISVIGTGAVSDRSLTGINGDMWLRSVDGARSYIQAVRQQGAWQHAPQSNEMRKIIQNDPPLLLPFCSGAYFDRRFLFTYGHHFQGITVVGEGLCVLNFDTISSMQGNTAPIWEGVWSGVNPCQIVTGRFNGRERCFMVCRSDTDNYNRLWEVLTTGDYDNGCQPITSRIATKAYSFTDKLGRKKLKTATMTISGIKDEVLFDIKYRPDYYPCFYDWASFSRTNTQKTCTAENCVIPNLQAGYDPRLYLNPPPSGCNQEVKTGLEIFSLAQVQLTWTGPATMSLMRLEALPQSEPVNGGCPTDGEAPVSLDCCPVVRTGYEITECIIDPPAPIPEPPLTPVLDGPVYKIAFLSDRSPVVLGGFTHINGDSTIGIGALNLDGTNLSSFNTGSGFNLVDSAYAAASIKIDGNDNIYAWYNRQAYNGDASAALRLYKIAKTGIQEWASVLTGNTVRDLQFQNGKLLVIGQCGATGGATSRLNLSDGSLDSSYAAGNGHGGIMAGVFGNGQIITTFAGSPPAAQSSLLKQDGSNDSSYAPASQFDGDILYGKGGVVVTSNNLFLFWGAFTTFNGYSCNGFVCVNQNGSVNTSISNTIKTYVADGSTIYRIVVGSDGKIMVVGEFTTFNGASVNRIIRLNSNGTIDPSFSSGSGFDNSVYDVQIDSQGYIVCGGAFLNYDGISMPYICKLNPNGTLIH